jgi:transcriptional regulator with XRE-family HTH domain
MSIKEILERLKTARERAGLSCSQANKLIDLPPAYLGLIESGSLALEMETFLKLCEIYDISEVWALTGVNPDFDPASVVEAAQYSNMDKGELGNLLEMLASLKHNKS